MIKIKFEYAIRIRKSGSSFQQLYITPSLWSLYDNHPYSENHWLVIELHWFFSGVGVKFSWKNKNVEPIPDAETLKAIFDKF